MKEFASTLIFASLLSIFIMLAGLDYKLFSSMVSQKEDMQSCRGLMKKFTQCRTVSRKPVEDANKDVENKALTFQEKQQL